MDNNRIKALHAGGRSIASLAQQFGVSEKEIKAILYVTTIYKENLRKSKKINLSVKERKALRLKNL